MLEKKLRLFSLILISILSIFCLILIFNAGRFHKLSKIWGEKKENSTSFSVMPYVREDAGTLKKYRDRTTIFHEIKFELPENFDVSAITYSENPLEKKISFSIKGFEKSYFDKYLILGKIKNVNEINYSFKDGTGTVSFLMKDEMLLKHSVESNFLCLDFIPLSEIIDKVIVLDASLGGKDTGKVINGISEKDINLNILLLLKENFDNNEKVLNGAYSADLSGLSLIRINEKNIGIFYTRLSDKDVSVEERVSLSNKYSADYFLSIRMNSTASGRMSEIKGAEALYKVTDESGESKAFADRVLNHMLLALGSDSKGTVAGEGHEIIDRVKSTVCIAEPGFMTNEEEFTKLSKKEYQKKTADALYSALLEGL